MQLIIKHKKKKFRYNKSKIKKRIFSINTKKIIKDLKIMIKTLQLNKLNLVTMKLSKENQESKEKKIDFLKTILKKKI